MGCHPIAFDWSASAACSAMSSSALGFVQSACDASGLRSLCGRLPPPQEWQLVSVTKCLREASAIIPKAGMGYLVAEAPVRVAGAHWQVVEAWSCNSQCQPKLHRTERRNSRFFKKGCRGRRTHDGKRRNSKLSESAWKGGAGLQACCRRVGNAWALAPEVLHQIADSMSLSG